MKKLLTTIAIITALQCSAQSGLYIGAGFNVGFASQTDSAGYKGSYSPKSLGIAFCTGYRLDNWIFDLTTQYSGALISSLTIGRIIGPVEIMAGLADNIIVGKEPLQFTHRFSYNITGRLQLGDFYFSCSQIQNNTYLGIGFRGLSNLTTY